MKFVLLLMLGVCLSLASCSGSDSPAATTTAEATSATSSNTAQPAPSATATKAPIDESAAAKQMLLTVADFPTGWAEEAASDEPSPLDKCDSDPNPKGRTAKASSGDFSSDGGRASISETIVIYQSPAGLDATFARLSSEFDCLKKMVNDGKLDTSDVKYSEASVSPLSFPDTGDHTEAYRAKIHIQAKGQTGLGSEADAYIDVVYIQQGRVGVSIQASDVFSPFDSATFEKTVQKAMAKIVEP